MHEIAEQKKIWDYFQGDGVESFRGSVGRLRFLLRLAIGLSGQQRWRALNIGTGNGWLEIAARRHGWAAVSLDISKVAIERVAAAQVPGLIGLIEANPHQDGSFDVVFCSEVLEHLTASQLRTGLADIARVLRPGGYLIGSVPFNETLAGGQVICPECGAHFHRWGHMQSFDHVRMRQLLEQSGLQVVRTETRAFPYFAERTLVNFAKSQIVGALGRLGVQSAYPSLLFVARK